MPCLRVPVKLVCKPQASVLAGAGLGQPGCQGAVPRRVGHLQRRLRDADNVGVPSGSPMRTCDMGGGGGGGAGVLRGGMRMAEMDREFLSFADQVRRGRCPPHLYGCSISFLQLGHRSGMDSGYQSWLVSFYDFSAMEVPSHLRGHVGHPQPMCGIFTSHSKVGSRKPSFGSQREITTLPVKPVANKKMPLKHCRAPFFLSLCKSEPSRVPL